MDPQALYRTLEGTFNPDAAVRHEAEGQLKQAESMPGFMGIIFQVTVAQELQENVRLAAALRLKNSLKHKDWNTPESPVQPAEKQLVKSSMVTAVIAAPSRVRNVLLECLRLILEYDFPQHWPTLVEEVVANLAGQDLTRIAGALSILRVVAKRFEYRPDAEARAPLDDIVQRCFPLLVQMFQYINSQPTIPPEGAILQKLLCKTYWSATNMRIPPYFYANPPHFAHWLDCFLQVMAQPVQTTDHLSPHWKVKKWVGHIANRLLNRHANPRGRSKADVQLAEAFLENYAAKFMEAFLQLCAWHRAKQYVSPQPLALGLNYLDSALDYQQTCDVLTSNLDALLYELIFPLLCFSDSDAELWKDNPQEYVRKLYDPLGDLYNPRLSATNLLLSLCNPTKPFHAKDCMPKLLPFLNVHLTKYQTDTQKDIRAKDGCLFALGSLRSRLRKSAEFKPLLEPLLITHVLPEFQSPHGFLRAKACWMCGQFSRIEWTNSEALGAIVRHILALMTDPDLPVRVQAGTTLKNFVRIKTTQQIVQPMLEQMVSALFKLMSEIDNDSVIETLEYIIEKFGDNLATAALSLCRMLCEHFVKTHPTLQENEDDERELQDEEEDQALAAAACLRALCTLVSAVHEHPELYPQMEQYLVPLFRLLLTKNKVEYLDETLELVSRFAYHSKTISPEMWQGVFPMLVECYHGWAQDYLSQLLDPFDNFISRDPATFARGSVNNVRFIQATYGIMEKCLADEDQSEEYNACPKLMDSILQNCRDYPSEVNEYVPRMFDLVMGAMKQHPDLGEGFKTLAMNVIALGLYYNAQLTIQYLQERQIVEPVFKMWLGIIPKMSRFYDKKVAAVGLTALLQAIVTHGTAWLPASYFTPACLKTLAGVVVKLVLTCHDETKRFDEASSDSSDEESEDSSDDDDLDEDSDDDGDDEGIEEEGPVKGGRGFQFNADDGGESLSKVIAEGREVKFGDKFNFLDDDDDDDLEDEDYECPVMDLAEGLLFRDVMGQMASVHPDLYGMVMGALTPDTQQQLQAAVAYAEAKKQKEAQAPAKP